MDNAKRIARLKDEEFQRIFGVKKKPIIVCERESERFPL